MAKIRILTEQTEESYERKMALAVNDERREHLNPSGVTWSPNEDVAYVSVAPEIFAHLNFDA